MLEVPLRAPGACEGPGTCDRKACGSVGSGFSPSSRKWGVGPGPALTHLPQRLHCPQPPHSAPQGPGASQASLPSSGPWLASILLPPTPPTWVPRWRGVQRAACWTARRTNLLLRTLSSQVGAAPGSALSLSLPLRREPGAERHPTPPGLAPSQACPRAQAAKSPRSTEPRGRRSPHGRWWERLSGRLLGPGTGTLALPVEPGAGSWDLCASGSPSAQC